MLRPNHVFMLAMMPRLGQVKEQLAPVMFPDVFSDDETEIVD